MYKQVVRRVVLYKQVVRRVVLYKQVVRWVVLNKQVVRWVVLYEYKQVASGQLKSCTFKKLFLFPGLRAPDYTLL